MIRRFDESTRNSAKEMEKCVKIKIRIEIKARIKTKMHLHMKIKIYTRIKIEIKIFIIWKFEGFFMHCYYKGQFGTSLFFRFRPHF